MVNKPKYKSCEGCGGECFYFMEAFPGRCFGQVKVIDEEQKINDDNDLIYIPFHACGNPLHMDKNYDWENDVIAGLTDQENGNT